LAFELVFVSLIIERNKTEIELMQDRCSQQDHYLYG